ncbi:hypothetical protein OK142_00930 [Agrobacterium sp. BT-220-3]|nr:hypothetical protein [Agrobacterium sp. BT-220-3]
MQSEKDALIELYAGDAFKNRNNTDLTIGVWRQHFVEFADKLAALSAAEPVSYQRKTVYGWREVDAADIPHYRSVGQEIRGLYTAPLAPFVAVEALEWKDVPDTSGEWVAAVGAMGNAYRCEVFSTESGNKWRVWSDAIRADLPTPFEALEEAKAAAQADYEARIRSALAAQVQDVTGLKLVGEVVPYRGALSSLTNGRDLQLNTHVSHLEIGTKLYAAAPAKQEG